MRLKVDSTALGALRDVVELSSKPHSLLAFLSQEFQWKEHSRALQNIKDVYTPAKWSM